MTIYTVNSFLSESFLELNQTLTSPVKMDSLPGHDFNASVSPATFHLKSPGKYAVNKAIVSSSQGVWNEDGDIDCCKENGDEDPNLIWFYYFAQNLTQIILSMPGLKHVEGINLPGILAFLLKNCKKTSHLKHMFYQKTMIYLRKHFKSRTTTTTR